MKQIIDIDYYPIRDDNLLKGQVIEYYRDDEA